MRPSRWTRPANTGLRIRRQPAIRPHVLVASARPDRHGVPPGYISSLPRGSGAVAHLAKTVQKFGKVCRYVSCAGERISDGLHRVIKLPVQQAALLVPLAPDLRAACLLLRLQCKGPKQPPLVPLHLHSRQGVIASTPANSVNVTLPSHNLTRTLTGPSQRGPREFCRLHHPAASGSCMMGRRPRALTHIPRDKGLQLA